MMIGIDTNVLLRYLMQDDLEQSERARQIMEEEVSEAQPAFISAIVLCESCWTLRSFYKISRPEILIFIDQLLLSAEISLEHREEVWQAQQQARLGRIDFVDALIGAIGKSQGCQFTYTFDKKAAQSAYFRLGLEPS